MNVLCVAAHPDDEVLGCGGTLARLAREGHAVHIALLGEGITARYASREAAHSSLLRALEEQAESVGRLLGAKAVSLHGLPDNRFDTVPFLDIVKIVEERVGVVAPHTLFTHQGGDLNLDHSLVHRAVLTATRPMAGGSVKEVYGFEVPSATEWAFQQFEPSFRPNVFVDVTDTLATKIEAMRVYGEELRDFPHPRSLETLTSLARFRGSTAGLRAAEAMQLIRRIL